VTGGLTDVTRVDGAAAVVVGAGAAVVAAGFVDEGATLEPELLFVLVAADVATAVGDGVAVVAADVAFDEAAVVAGFDAPPDTTAPALPAESSTPSGITAGPGAVYSVTGEYMLKRRPGSLGSYAPGNLTPAGAKDPLPDILI
jgi:hypothetical protein